MAYGNEADEIRTLGKVLEKGYVYRGLKPVNWCFDCGSALAEAEVEYADKKDFAIDVGFPLPDDQRNRLARAFALEHLPNGPVYAVIWTTTPWTIPSNQALNVHPEFYYSLIPTEKGALILATELWRQCLDRYGLKQGPASSDSVHSCKGSDLEQIEFMHPFYERRSPVYLGEYVTLDTGTGIVHSAPAYGVEDFDSCHRYGMKDEEILTPVMGDGKYVASLPFFGGMMIWKANAEIVKKIDAAGALFNAENYTHSYMHCWRHKTPIIYRASTQWFASMDAPPGFNGAKPTETLRATALRGIENTRFFPGWGQARLHGMIANRPDWTLSRQRQWGVPMPFFIHKETNELHPRTLELLERVASRVEAGGIEAWQTLDTKDLLGADSEHYVKIKDTLDVWFDSGSTHQTVMGGPDGEKTGAGSHGRDLRFPADLYLEGSDQHRGWFHSSLLVSCMLNGVPPYKALLTHGFFVDGEGRKMSKSKGNMIVPQEIAGTLGAEILRLWVASTDYSGELSISHEILKRVVESYRRIRNTLRFLLANTSDFDIARDAIPVEELVEIDRYALALTAKLQDDMAGDYGRYQFHLVAQRLQTFCSEDIGAFYLDILKDRLYTTAPGSHARRSAQTALWHITSSVVRLMAPILSFTAEELWSVFNGRKENCEDDSVFFQTLHVLPAVQDAALLLGRWEEMRAIRADVRRQLEELRTAGKIGSSLAAEVDFHVPPEQAAFLESFGEDLRFVLLTSAARVHAAGDGQVQVVPSTHAKCERCWHFRADVGTVGAHPTICARCVGNLTGADEKRVHA